MKKLRNSSVQEFYSNFSIKDCIFKMHLLWMQQHLYILEQGGQNCGQILHSQMQIQTNMTW